MLSAMEGVMSVAFYKAVLAVPMGSVTIQTTKLSFGATTGSTGRVRWGNFEVKEVVQI